MPSQTEKNVSRTIYLVVVTIAMLILVLPFALPVILAGSIALALYPLLAMLERKGMGRKKAAALLTIFFAIVISIPVFYFVVKGVETVTVHLEEISIAEIKKEGVSSFVTGMRNDLVQMIHRLGAKSGAGSFLTHQKINSYLTTGSTYLLNFFQSFLALLPLMFLYLLITILCVYSFLKNSRNVRCTFQKIFGFTEEKMDDLVKIFINNSRQVYISNIATGGIQSLIVATAAAILGIGQFFLVFFVTLVLSFIPVIGAAPVAFICGAIAFVQGNTTHAIIMVVVGCFTGVVDNFLRPWLAAFGESRIPPIAAFVCVLGGALLLGFPGLFLGLLLGSVAFDTLPFFWKELGKSSDSQIPL